MAVTPGDDGFPAALRPTYRAEHLLGQGGMGAVWAATRLEDGRSVAIKVMAPHLGSDRIFLKRFEREAALCGRTVHPGLVEFIAAGQADGSHYLVMEKVEGQTLRSLIEESRPLGAEESLEKARQLADCLGALHERDLIHRDVKPDNVMVCADGGVKLLDLGIARDLDATALTETGTILGTLWYLAPEVCRGERATSAADVFALGVLLGECLCRHCPFRGFRKRPSDLVVRRARGEAVLQRPPGLAGDVWQLVERLTAHCLTVRPPHGRAAAGAIDELLTRAGSLVDNGGATIVKGSAAPPQTTRSAPRPVSSTTIRWLLAVLPVVIALLCLGNWYLSHGSSSLPVVSPRSKTVGERYRQRLEDFVGRADSDSTTTGLARLPEGVDGIEARAYILGELQVLGSRSVVAPRTKSECRSSGRRFAGLLHLLVSLPPMTINTDELDECLLPLYSITRANLDTLSTETRPFEPDDRAIRESLGLPVEDGGPDRVLFREILRGVCLALDEARQGRRLHPALALCRAFLVEKKSVHGGKARGNELVKVVQKRVEEEGMATIPLTVDYRMLCLRYRARCLTFLVNKVPGAVAELRATAECCLELADSAPRVKRYTSFRHNLAFGACRDLVSGLLKSDHRKDVADGEEMGHYLMDEYPKVMRGCPRDFFEDELRYRLYTRLRRALADDDKKFPEFKQRYGDLEQKYQAEHTRSR